MVVDVHCHAFQLFRPRRGPSPFAFESGPYEAYISPGLTKRVPRWIVRRILGVDAHDDPARVNAAMEAFFERHVLGATAVDRSVVLAFDACHTDEGVAAPPGTAARNRTHLYVSNGYAHALVTRHPDRLWFGASVHPYRRDALAALDTVAAAGAVLIKWLPVAQNIDASDPRTAAFVEHAGRIGMPMLVHYGGENALPTAHRRLEDPTPLLAVLERLHAAGRMPTVIIAHAATPEFPWASARHFRALVDAMRGPLRDAPLYADLAGLATPNRGRWLKRLAYWRELHGRLVYGSDFPVPTFPFVFRWRLGRAYRDVCACASWVDRDVRLKRALGFDEAVFTRMGDVLMRRARGDARTV